MAESTARPHLELVSGDGEPARAVRLLDIPRQRVALGKVAVLQLMAKLGHIPRHRNYLLTSYDELGNFIPHQLNLRDAPWNEALAVSESYRESVFPLGAVVDTEDKGVDFYLLETLAKSFSLPPTQPSALDIEEEMLRTEALLDMYAVPGAQPTTR